MTFGLIISVFVVMSIVVAVIYDTKRSQKQEALFKSLASKRGGSISKGTFFKDPKLHIEKNDRTIDVYYKAGTRHSPGYTCFEVSIDYVKDYSTLIYVDEPISKLFKVFGMQDIEINDPGFDDAFVIKSNDEMFVLNFLNSELRDMLMRFNSHQLNPDLIHRPSLVIEQGKLHFYIEGDLDSEATYNEFIDAGMIILDRLQQIGVVKEQKKKKVRDSIRTPVNHPEPLETN